MLINSIDEIAITLPSDPLLKVKRYPSLFHFFILHALTFTQSEQMIAK